MNTLHSINRKLLTQDDTYDLLLKLPNKVYSYLVRKTDAAYKCKILVCDVNKYNTIDKHEAVLSIINAISSKQDIVFKQPSLDIQIEMYTPFIYSLAREQQIHWHYLEYDDLVQMCYLTMIRLYRQGYYLNNLLLRTAYVRDVLQSIRRNNTEYELVSIDDRYGKDDSLTVADTLEDIAYSNERADNEQLEEIFAIYSIVKDLIVELLGERRTEQLLKEYATHNTTNAGRNAMIRIKRHFDRNNITLKSIRGEL